MGLGAIGAGAALGGVGTAVLGRDYVRSREVHRRSVAEARETLRRQDSDALPSAERLRLREVSRTDGALDGPIYAGAPIALAGFGLASYGGLSGLVAVGGDAGRAAVEVGLAARSPVAGGLAGLLVGILAETPESLRALKRAQRITGFGMGVLGAAGAVAAYQLLIHPTNQRG